MTAGYFYADKIWTRNLMTKMSWAGGSKDRDVSKSSFKNFEHLLNFFYSVLRQHAPMCTITEVTKFIKSKIIQHSARRAAGSGKRDSAPKFRIRYFDRDNVDAPKKPKKTKAQKKEYEQQVTTDGSIITVEKRPKISQILSTLPIGNINPEEVPIHIMNDESKPITEVAQSLFNSIDDTVNSKPTTTTEMNHPTLSVESHSTTDETTSAPKTEHNTPPLDELESITEQNTISEDTEKSNDDDDKQNGESGSDDNGSGSSDDGEDAFFGFEGESDDAEDGELLSVRSLILIHISSDFRNMTEFHFIAV